MKPGVTVYKKKTDFAVHSNANRLWLLLFDSADAETPSQEIEMRPENNSLWCASVPNAGPGTFYLYKTDAIPEQWLLDPFAKSVHLPRKWGETTGLQPGQHIHTGKHFPKCVVVDDTFDWSGENRPNTPLEKTVIYEVHLRGFTQAENGGTYLDFIKKIPYLKKLGITAVEFLPIAEFNELEFLLEGKNRKNLLNFWGYSPIAFFAPMSRYASSAEPAAAVTEFKTLVKELHNADIEVILDVVFNHTGEGPFNGPTYSFRGLEEATYYLLNSDGTYPDWSGCGNTVNANHPVTQHLIIECLKYWAHEMHVDGFRFDLATVLCRDEHSRLLDNPPVIHAIEKEPALKHIKLIAEAWDAHGTYQVGSFPGKRFSEWNGLYRDDIRRFWNENSTVGPLATRLAGSSDLYEKNSGSPLKSINFITAHDGFTLADLVSYARKHNYDNGEENRDGDDQNRSINFGAEGPTDDPGIQARRLRQQKNILATLLLSGGIPMITAGDEFGRTQQGSNNAYCQDSELSWMDWSLAETNRELLEFTKKLLSLRQKNPALHTGKFYTEKDVEWLGTEGRPVDWDHDRALGMHLKGKDPLLILINNEPIDLSFEFPEGSWELLLSTSPDVTAPTSQDTFLPVPSGTLCILQKT